MNKINRLLASYAKFIRVPWRDDAAAAQRAIFCVYNEDEELRLRAKIDEFEIATRDAGHEWFVFDLSKTFADWLSAQRYAESYFRKPHLLTTLLPKYLTYIVDQFDEFLKESGVSNNSVVALKGVGSLFGFLKVKAIVDKVAPMVKGRLVLFFPGTFENNNYRLLDGYDGWNYLAVLITADREV